MQATKYISIIKFQYQANQTSNYSAKLSLNNPPSTSTCTTAGAGAAGLKPQIGPFWLTPGSRNVGGICIGPWDWAVGVVGLSSVTVDPDVDSGPDVVDVEAEAEADEEAGAGVLDMDHRPRTHPPTRRLRDGLREGSVPEPDALLSAVPLPFPVPLLEPLAKVSSSRLGDFSVDIDGAWPSAVTVVVEVTGGGGMGSRSPPQERFLREERGHFAWAWAWAWARDRGRVWVGEWMSIPATEKKSPWACLRACPRAWRSDGEPNDEDSSSLSSGMAGTFHGNMSSSASSSSITRSTVSGNGSFWRWWQGVSGDVGIES